MTTIKIRKGLGKSVILEGIEDANGNLINLIGKSVTLTIGDKDQTNFASGEGSLYRQTINVTQAGNLMYPISSTITAQMVESQDQYVYDLATGVEGSDYYLHGLYPVTVTA